MQVDGLGDHVTINYVDEKFCQVFREVYEAVLSMLPPNAYFVMKLRMNRLVMPSAEDPNAHSWMMDMYLPPRLALVGEFAESFCFFSNLH